MLDYKLSNLAYKFHPFENLIITASLLVLRPLMSLSVYHHLILLSALWKRLVFFDKPKFQDEEIVSSTAIARRTIIAIKHM